MIGYHKEIDLWVHGEMRQIHRRSKGEDTWEPAEKKRSKLKPQKYIHFFKGSINEEAEDPGRT